MGNSIYFNVSKDKETKAFNFSRLPSRKAVKCAKVVTIGGVSVMLGVSGKMYGTWRDVGRNIAFTANRPWTADLAEMLLLLGKLTEEECNYFKETIKRKKEQRDIGWASHDMLENARRSGIKLTKSQTEKIKSNVKVWEGK